MQDTMTATLDHSFDFKRHNLSLQEYLNEFTLRYDDAETKTNLQINEIGKTHLLLRHSELSSKIIDDIKLKMNGDLSRYTEMSQLLHRLSRCGGL